MIDDHTGLIIVEIPIGVIPTMNYKLLKKNIYK